MQFYCRKQGSKKIQLLTLGIKKYFKTFFQKNYINIYCTALSKCLLPPLILSRLVKNPQERSLSPLQFFLLLCLACNSLQFKLFVKYAQKDISPAPLYFPGWSNNLQLLPFRIRSRQHLFICTHSALIQNFSLRLIQLS